MTSLYREAAETAIQHEHAEEFDLAATFWRRAESVAVRFLNRAWAGERAELCEKRHSLTARNRMLRAETLIRLEKAAETKAKKKLAESLEAHMNKTTSGEESR